MSKYFLIVSVIVLIVSASSSLHAQHNTEVRYTIENTFKTNILSTPPLNSQPINKYSVVNVSCYKAIFCKMESRANNKNKLQIKPRIGTLAYVNSLEGK